MLNPLPVIGAALGTFLATFALLVGRVVTGTDPAAHLVSAATLSSTRNGSGTPLRTTASGAVIPVAASAGTGTRSAETTVRLATRTSGVGGVTHDD
jgi:hypothetical protein